jgi:hypothetical protein
MSTPSIGPKPAFSPLKLPPNLITKLPPAAAAKFAPALDGKVQPALDSKAPPALDGKISPALASKMRGVAQDFEQVFLNSMFSQMFTGADGDGPVGGSQATGVWRSFLTDEYAKNFAKAGGIGLGDQIYRELIAQQAAASK